MIRVLLCLASIAQPADASDAPTLDTVLRRHQQYLDRIHTVDATIEFRESVDRGTNWSVAMRYRWLKDGPRERVTMWANGYTDEGGVRRDKEVRSDTSFAPDETRILQRWDPEKPPPEPPSPANQYHGAAAQIAGPVRDGTISHQPPFYLMLAPTLTDYLPAAVRTGSNVSLARGMHNGLPIWDVRFGTKAGMEASYRVGLDPERGFAIVRHEVRSRAGVGVSEVVEFREVEDGLYFPVLIRQTSPDQPEKLYERRVTHLKVNEPVAPESLVVNFPTGMLVPDTRVVPRRLSIWGSDGPERTFKTPQEYWLYERGSASRQSANSSLWFLLATAATVVAVIVLCLIRGRIARAA